MGKNILFLILIIMITGCAQKYGYKYDTSAINDMELWKTTESDAISLVGTPISESKLSNGITIYEYFYAKSGPMGHYLDAMQFQVLDGLVINKSQRSARY